MTEPHDVVVPLGRRLEALARSRMAASAPRLVWATPLAVALRHAEGLADVVGGRFQRTEAPPRVEPVVRTHPPGRGLTDSRREPEPATGRAAPGEPTANAEASADDVLRLPPDVRSRLRREVGRAADLMRVHGGADADAHARAADADAVTSGQDVYLRQGRWAPRREEGVALLAHEATHVAARVDPGAGWLRAVGGQAEEDAARAVERSLLGRGAVPSPTRVGGSTWPDSPAASDRRAGDLRGRGHPGSVASASDGHSAPHGAATAPPPTATLRGSAMRAGVDRDLTAATGTPDLDELRRGVVAEVMQRLRTEIERGA